MTKFGDAEMDGVVSLYEKGVKTTTIAKAIEMPLYRVKAIVAASKEGDDFLKQVIDMKRRGMTDSDIARALGKSKQYISRITGVRRSLPGDKRNHVIALDQGQWRKLMGMAEEFGLIVDDGQHAGRGSVRKLLEQIALGNLTVLKDRNFS
jgi:hypothetical protein